MRVHAVAVVLVTALVTTAAAKPRGDRRVAAAEESAAKKPRADRSIGAPWSGRLVAAARLEDEGERFYLRRPARTYGTRTTVRFVKQAIRDVYTSHPKAHDLAVGDLSAEAGGWITEHASHQSGRDVDLGLFYKKPPKGYPASFIVATTENLDMAAMWTLLSSLARTTDEDGGVQMIFFDAKLTAALRKWAEKREINAKRQAKVFSLLHHHPNHADHIHVRFKCRARDTKCR